MTKKIPVSRTLESENWDSATDTVLNTALSQLLPFLQHHSAKIVADALLERLHTHLQTELSYIRTGKSSDGLGEYTSAKTFRDRFIGTPISYKQQLPTEFNMAQNLVSRTEDCIRFSNKRSSGS
jgi:hypothetical protein